MNQIHRQLSRCGARIRSPISAPHDGDCANDRYDEADRAEHSDAEDGAHADCREEPEDGPGTAHRTSNCAGTDQRQVLPLGAHAAAPKSE